MHSWQISADLTPTGLQIISTNNEVKKVLLTQINQNGHRPYLHPILLPGHTFELTQNAPQHHPWQHGLYFAYHGINGADFWLDHGEGVGHYSENQTMIVSQGPHLIAWQSHCKGIHQNSMELFQEQITWLMSIKNDRIYLQPTYEMTALTDLTIEQCLYGGLFLRMPWKKDLSVFLENSEGNLGLDAEQKQADWLDMRSNWGSLDLQEYGVLIVQHPQAGQVAAPWRVDKNYGVGPSEVIKGCLKIDKGVTLKLCYTLVFYAGQLKKEDRTLILNSLQEPINV